MKESDKRGFTLVEIIVVVAVIGLLSLVVFASFEDSRKKARDTARIADLEQIKAAVQVYGVTYKEYPDSLDDLVTAGLFSSVPEDPINEDEYVYTYDNNESCFSLTGKSERNESDIVAGNCPE